MGRNVEAYRKERVPGGVDPKALILKGSDMPAIADAIGRLKEMEFPTGRLHRIVKGLLSADKRTREAAKTEGDAMAIGESPFSEPLLVLLKSAGGDCAEWLHIANLWDYVG